MTVPCSTKFVSSACDLRKNTHYLHNERILPFSHMRSSKQRDYGEKQSNSFCCSRTSLFAGFRMTFKYIPSLLLFVNHNKENSDVAFMVENEPIYANIELLSGWNTCVRQIRSSTTTHFLCEMFLYAELIEGHMKLFVRLSHCS